MSIVPDAVPSSRRVACTAALQSTIGVTARNAQHDDPVVPDLSPEGRELLSPEEFFEPTSIGDALPSGAQLFREWDQARNEELGPRKKRLYILDDKRDSESDKSTHAVEKQETENLRTQETFPSEYLVDLEDKEKQERPSVSTLPHGANATDSKQQPSCRRRKSVLFPPKPKSGIPLNTVGDAGPQSVPSESASGIVGVMGRKVNIDRIIGDNNDGTTGSLYSMLRAWVQDDPDQTPVRDSRPATPCRKSLLEYVSMKVNDEKSNSDADAHANHRHETNQIEGETLDVLGWLSKDPYQRKLSIPFYPSQEKMRVLHERREAKRKAKTARRKRLAAAKESLRRKGIRV